MIKLNGYFIQPTVFPDKTQQVYKLPEEAFKPLSVISWEYENDSEFMCISQLVMLLKQKNTKAIQLDMPYLPYGRQDKPVSNEETFGLHTFANLINSLELDAVTFYDAHSSVASDFIKNSINIEPKHIYDLTNQYDAVVYPDQGAFNRYKNKLEKKSITCVKKRHWQTGNIVAQSLCEDLLNDGFIDKEIHTLLVLDDLCDAGGTFVGLIDLLRKEGYNNQIDLVVSHIVQNSSIERLKKAGYTNIFDRNGKRA